MSNYIEVTVRLKKSMLMKLLKEGSVRFTRVQFEQLAQDPKFLHAIAKDLVESWEQLNDDSDKFDVAQGLIEGDPAYWDGVNQQKASGLWKKYGISQSLE